jgi:coenzyme PQQ biosynthesis protein PqqD
MSKDWQPALAASALLRYDAVRKASVLLLPERVVLLNGPAGKILRLCDGQRGVGEIARQIQVTYGKTDPDERKSLPGCGGDRSPGTPRHVEGSPALGDVQAEAHPVVASVVGFLERMADLGCVR